MSATPQHLDAHFSSEPGIPPRHRPELRISAGRGSYQTGPAAWQLQPPRKPTPLLEVEGVLAKLEAAAPNPTGSIKDRMVEYVLARNLAAGTLRAGMTIVEASSGNTGIAAAYFGREAGCRVIIVMPSNMTAERKRAITALGAELRLVAPGDFARAAGVRDELVARDPAGCFNLDQFANPLNEQCHYATTAVEILRQLEQQHVPTVDALVAGTGTGGTLVGIGLRLKEAFPQLRVAAVEPAESNIMTRHLQSRRAGGGARLAFADPRQHRIGGIGDGFIPRLATDGGENLHPIIDEVLEVSDEQAIAAARRLKVERGLCVGVSSGANFVAAQMLRARGFGPVVTVFPDGAHKYASLGLEVCCAGQCQHHCSRPPTTEPELMTHATAAVR